MKRSWLRRGSALSLAGIIMLASAGQAVYATDSGVMTEDNNQALENETELELNRILGELSRINGEIIKVNQVLVGDGTDSHKGILGSLKDIEMPTEEDQVDGVKGLMELDQPVEDPSILDLTPLVPSEKLEDREEDGSEPSGELEEGKKDPDDPYKKIEEEIPGGDNSVKDVDLDSATFGDENEKGNKDKIDIEVESGLEENTAYLSRQKQLLAYRGSLLAAGETGGVGETIDITNLQPNNQVKGKMNSINTELKTINTSLEASYDGFIDIALEVMAKKEAGVDFNTNASDDIENLKASLNNQVEEFKKLEGELVEIKKDLESFRQDNPIIENYFTNVSENPTFPKNVKVIDLVEDEIFNAEQRLDSIASSFSDLADKNIRLVSGVSHLETLDEDEIDLAIFENTISISSGNLTVKGKSGNGKTRFIFKRKSFDEDEIEVDNSNKSFFKVEGNVKLALENIILDGGGFAGGIYNTSTGLVLKNLDFINSNVLEDSVKNIPGSLIYNDDDKVNGSGIDFSIKFIGTINFKNNQAKNIIHSNTASSGTGNASIIFEGEDNDVNQKVLLDNNIVSHNIIQNDTKNAPFIFNQSVEFINNRARNIIYNYVDTRIEFKQGASFKNNIAVGIKDASEKIKDGTGNIIYTNHNNAFTGSEESPEEKIGLHFLGNVNFIDNEAHNIIHSYITREANGSILFDKSYSNQSWKDEEMVNFINNQVSNSLILNDRLLNDRINAPFTFKLPVNFIGNFSGNKDSILLSHREGEMDFKKEAKFINNSFGQALVYNESNSDDNLSKINFAQAAFINNQVASEAGAIIWDHNLSSSGEDWKITRVKIRKPIIDYGADDYLSLGQQVVGESGFIYNEKIYDDFLVLDNRVGEDNGAVIKITSKLNTPETSETAWTLPNMKKEFRFDPKGGSLASGSLGPFGLLNIETPILVREGYDFSYWSPSPYNIQNISEYINTKDSQGLIGADLSQLYGNFAVKNIVAQWSKLERPSSGGGGGSSSSDRDRDRDKDKQEEKKPEEKKPEEVEKKPEELINGRPVSQVIEDYENATGEAKRELREQLMGVTIEDGLEYKFKKEEHAAYMQGYKDNTFKPHQYVTREEAASVILRVLEPRFIEEVETDQHDFKDLEKGRWSEVAIASLANGEIMNGYGDGTFRPTRYISRAELSRTVARFTDIIIEETKFEDIIAHWAEDYINSARREGWINGYEDGSFRPDSLVTRAELTALVNGILERKVSRENILPGAKTYLDLEYDKWYYPVIMEAINGHHHDINEKKDGSEIWLDLMDESFF